jgi:DNA-binding NtrC family response regulator
MPVEPPKSTSFHRKLAARPIREASMPRVLVVDDQADVRTMISIVLRIHQFEIVEAESAASALKLFEDASFGEASLDLAIVDIFLQGTNGSDLIAALRRHVPGLPVVAISGMTALDFLSEAPELSDVVCLQKPFRPRDLMRAIEAARESRRQSGGAVAAAAR